MLLVIVKVDITVQGDQKHLVHHLSFAPLVITALQAVLFLCLVPVVVIQTQRACQNVSHVQLDTTV